MDPQTADKILIEMLAQWHQVDKKKLGKLLVEHLHLVECSPPYEPYTAQVQRLVQRKLTQTEMDELDDLHSQLCGKPTDVYEIVE